MTILYGARTPHDLVYKDELKVWAERSDVDFRMTVDLAEEGWSGTVGVVPVLFDKVSSPAVNACLCLWPTILSLPQFGSRLTLRVDPLSAVFLAIVALIALLSTMYSVRYMEHYTRDGVAKFFPVLLLSVASMVGVLVATDFSLLPRLLGIHDADLILPGDI